MHSTRLDERMGGRRDIRQQIRVALGQKVRGAQPPVVTVDPEQSGLHLEEPDHVDHGVDRDQRGTVGKRYTEVGPLAIGDTDHPHGTQSDGAGRRGGVVAFVACQAERQRGDGDDAPRPESRRRVHRDDLDHATVHVVIVGQRTRGEHQRDAGRRYGRVDHVDRSGGFTRRRGCASASTIVPSSVT